MIKVGVTSWADRSLLASGWYPEGVRTAEERLRFYASQFSLVENDMPYYALPDPEMARTWAERTPPGFTMNLKAHALMTGHYTDPGRLPSDLRERLPADRERIYPRHLPEGMLREIEDRFVAAAEALGERLGLLLFQFPVWFPRSREARGELRRIAERFARFRVAVEFRNRTWMSARNLVSTLDELRDLGLSYTCVDEPQGFVSSVPPIVAVTSDVGLVRLHGRNAARWRRGAETAAERFDYLYSLDEIRGWAARAHHLSQRARDVHVLFNNCHRDYAVRNAGQMQELLRPAFTELRPT